MRFKGWFGPKLIGYGVGPRSWQGWLATAAFTAALIGGVRWFKPLQFGLPVWTPMLLIVALLGLYLLLVWATYDPDL